jgi:RHS repeat-associated protein
VWIEEKDAQGTVTSVRRYVWADGAQPAEERDGANTVLRRFYAEGEHAPGATGPLARLFYAKDHLGSVREVTDAAGVLRARYDYGFWGNRTRVSGDAETAVGYTGHHHHGKSGLVLTWYRAYDPDTGRWLSRDPIGEDGGLNLYGYVGNQLVSLWDPIGLYSWEDFGYDAASVILTAADIALGGPTGEGIVPAMAMQAAKQAVKESAKNAGKGLLLKECRRLADKELKKHVGDVHKAKEIMKNQFGKSFKGDKNFDVLIDKAGNTVLKGNQSGTLVPTGVPPSAFAP